MNKKNKSKVYFLCLYLLYVFKCPSSGGIGLGVNFSVLCGGRYFLLWAGVTVGTRDKLEEGEEVAELGLMTCLLCRRLERFGEE